MPSLIGNKPNQVPTNGDLGTMAFQDAENVKAGVVTADRLTVDGTTLVVDSTNDRVGIGTTVPAMTLDVQSASGGTTVRLRNTTGNFIDFIETAGSTRTGYIGTTNGTNFVVHNDKAGHMQFDTNNLERMRIDSSGSVGIGTSSPSSYQFNGIAPLVIANTSGNATFSIVSSTTGIGYIGFADGTSGTSRYSGNIRYDHSADYMAFATNGGSDALRIDSSGNLMVGITTSQGLARFYRTTSGDVVTAQNTNDGTHANFVSRRAGTSGQAVYFDCAGNQAGTITHPTTTSTTYGSGSDYRLKDNIQPLTNALNIVGQLKPSKWNWKTDGSEDSGFIAHELQEFFPHAVTGKKDEIDGEGKPIYQCVDTSFLVATLTAAIQEQQVIINELKAQLTDMSLTLVDAKARIETLENK